MGHGVHTKYDLTVASGATLTTTAIDLGRAFARMHLDIPARSNTTLYIKASADNTTFRRVYFTADRAGAEAVFQVLSATTNAIVPCPHGIRYVKLESQDAVTDGLTVKIIAADF